MLKNKVPLPINIADVCKYQIVINIIKVVKRHTAETEVQIVIR